MLFFYRKLIVKFPFALRNINKPLYNKIRNLERQLARSNKSLERAKKFLFDQAKKGKDSNVKAGNYTKKMPKEEPVKGAQKRKSGFKTGKSKRQKLEEPSLSPDTDIRTHELQVEIHVPSEQLLAEPVDEHLEPNNEIQVTEQVNKDIPTPKREAFKFLRDEKLSPTKIPTIAKELIAYKVLSEQVSRAPKKVKKLLLSPQGVNKKSRSASRIAKSVGVHRQNVFAQRSSRASKQRERLLLKNSVINFLKMPENSSEMPGKKDSSEGVRHFALNDTITHLHKKFVEQHPTIKISRAKFARMRPVWMKTVSVSQRRQCQCIYHSNGQLLLNAIKQKLSVNDFIKTYSEDQIETIVSEIPQGRKRFLRWQKVDVPSNDTVVEKQRKQLITMEREEFIELFINDFIFLREHVRRMLTQFNQIRHLKSILPEMLHVTVQMDYSENWKIKYQDEISAAFYDKNTVTIHPMVVHYRNNGVLRHKSIVGVSGVYQHSAATTAAFISKLVPKMLEFLPDLEGIHYLTDSPTSQYRNKSIVKLVAKHRSWFHGIPCSWHYLEANHGKGPSDGVGGGVKKAADNAVKSGLIIDTAEKFYNWGVNYDGPMEFVSITESDVERYSKKFESSSPVKGISKMHTLVPYGNFVYMRETSCVQQCCSEGPMCEGWMKTNVKVSGDDDVPLSYVKRKLNQ